MTTITVDEDCLRKVDKLQSLLKLRSSNISGETITRGSVVNYAVSQQISAMTVPIPSRWVNPNVAIMSSTGQPMPFNYTSQNTSYTVGDPPTGVPESTAIMYAMVQNTNNGERAVRRSRRNTGGEK